MKARPHAFNDEPPLSTRVYHYWLHNRSADILALHARRRGLSCARFCRFCKSAFKNESAAPPAHSLSYSSFTHPPSAAGGGAASSDRSCSNAHYVLQTEYRGVVTIMAVYVPLVSCAGCMRVHLVTLLPEVVRLDFIVL
jgi:hypothetical protein